MVMYLSDEDIREIAEYSTDQWLLKLGDNFRVYSALAEDAALSTPALCQRLLAAKAQRDFAIQTINEISRFADKQGNQSGTIRVLIQRSADEAAKQWPDHHWS